jgi:hypothetical protein
MKWDWKGSLELLVNVVYAIDTCLTKRGCYTIIRNYFGADSKCYETLLLTTVMIWHDQVNFRNWSRYR